MVYKFPVGGQWEESEWEIQTNVEVDSRGIPQCDHCHSGRSKREVTAMGTEYFVPVHICPRVVVGINEGGHNSTGICLDCILEAAKTLEEKIKAPVIYYDHQTESWLDQADPSFRVDYTPETAAELDKTFSSQSEFLRWYKG